MAHMGEHPSIFSGCGPANYVAVQINDIHQARNALVCYKPLAADGLPIFSSWFGLNLHIFLWEADALKGSWAPFPWPEPPRF